MGIEDRMDAVHARLEEALRRLAEAQAIAHLGSWEWDVARDVVTWSDEMFRIYGLEPQSRTVDYIRFLELVHPDDRQLVDRSMQKAFAEASSFEFEHRIVRPDGEQRLLQARGRAVADEKGTVIRMVGTGHDITEQREARDQATVATAVAQQVSDLQQITDAALSHLGLDELLPELLARISDALGVEDAAVLLMDDDHETLELRAARGLGRDEIGFKLGVGTGFGGRVARERRTVVIGEGAHEHLASPALRAASVESVIGVPLILRDEVLGVLHVGSVEPRRFTGDEIALVELAAERAALAIGHARIYERQRGAAETLQRALLPAKLPVLENVKAAVRYVPAADGVEVGGDWYDVIPLPNGDVGVALGDVTGHGLEAAVLMAQLRHGLRAYALDHLEPAEVADRLDALIHTPDMEQLATLVYAVISPDRWMRYVNAGHLPPLVIGADRSTRLLDTQGGLPVGCRHANGYSTYKTRLERGDILVLYTDGLVERRGESIDDGIARLREIAARGPADPRELVDHILHALLPGADGEDDIALLAVRPEVGTCDDRLVASQPMAEIQPLHAVRYDTRTAGALENLVAPPYDVIDDQMRHELIAKSPFNIVEVDLPSPEAGEDPYAHAEHIFEAWLQQGVMVKEREPSIWVMRQQFRLGGETLNRTGFFARVRVEDYGQGRIRPHERTHPGPKEDRLRLTRATRANLSPIFSLFHDPGDAAWAVLAPITETEPFATVVDADGIADRLWRVSDPDVIADLQAALAERELLIADGHHRYETARVYAQEIGGEGDHNYVLQFLCSMADPGMVILPTHRLLTDLKTPEKQEGIANTLREHFEIEKVDLEDIEPPAGELPALGYIDAHFKQPFRLTLKDPKSLEQAMPDKPDAYRRLDTAALEALILRGPAGLSEDDISHLNGLAYSKDTDDALAAINDGRADAAFIMRGTPIDQVREVAAAGETMPPKSTFFYPKIPTGLLINPLE